MLLTMTDVDLTGKRVMIREDFNVPMASGRIANDRRLKAALPTIRYALAKKAKIILISHLGRPTEGQYAEEFSLAPIAKRLSELLNYKVRLVGDWIDGVAMRDDEIILGENVRFLPGEKHNDPVLAKKMARLCEVFVMDAFATAHRAEASTCGIIEFAPTACAGLLFKDELEALTQAFYNPKRPVVAIVGGSKVSTKLTILQELLKRIDNLILGGAIANTFLVAKGYKIGASRYEEDLIVAAKELLKTAGDRIKLPSDVMVAKEFMATSKSQLKKITEVGGDDIILDVGPATIEQFTAMLQEASTIIWNGPLGVFEWQAFDQGTKAIAIAVAKSQAFTLAGGGDTLAAIDKYNIAEQLSYISTGGGAFLEFLEGKTLPAVAMLTQKSTQG